MGRQIMSLMRHTWSVPPSPDSLTLTMVYGSLVCHWKSTTCKYGNHDDHLTLQA